MNLDVKTLFDVVLTMIVPVIGGFVATKAKILGDEYPKKLSHLVLYVFQPFLLASAVLGSEYSPKKALSGLTVLIIGVIAHALAALVAFLLSSAFRDKGVGRIVEHSIIFGNTGFFGIPVIRAVYGEEGVFYTGFFVIIFNVVLWSYGNLVLKRATSDIKISPLKIIFNAGTIPCTIGLLLYFLRVPIYPPIITGMKSIGSACTPLSMVIIGSLFARVPIKNLLRNWQACVACVSKLFIVPIVTAIVLKLLCFPEYFAVFGALMMSLPSAASTAMFAQNYDLNSELAAEIVGLCTVLSIVTIPLVGQIINFIV